MSKQQIICPNCGERFIPDKSNKRLSRKKSEGSFDFDDQIQLQRINDLLKEKKIEFGVKEKPERR